MAARACAHQDQAIDAGFKRLLCVAHVDYVVQDDAPIGVHARHHFVRGAQRRDRDRHLAADADLHIVGQPVVGLVHDLVDGVRRDDRFRIGLAMVFELALDLGQPRVEGFLGPRIERRKRTHHARLALLGDEPRITRDEHRRADHGKREILKNGRK